MNTCLRILALVGQVSAPLLSYEIVAAIGFLAAVASRVALRPRDFRVKRARLWLAGQFPDLFVEKSN